MSNLRRRNALVVREISVVVPGRTKVVAPGVSESRGIQSGHVRRYSTHRTLVNPEKTVLKKVIISSVNRALVVPAPTVKLPPLPGQGGLISNRREFMRRMLRLGEFKDWINNFSKNIDMIFDRLYDLYTDEADYPEVPVDDNDLSEWFVGLIDIDVFPDDENGFRDTVEAFYYGNWPESNFFEHNKKMVAIQEIPENAHFNIPVYFNMFRDPFHEKILLSDINGWPNAINEDNFIKFVSFMNVFDIKEAMKDPYVSSLRKSDVPFIFLRANDLKKDITGAGLLSVIIPKEYENDKNWILTNNAPILPLARREFSEKDLFDIAGGRWNRQYIEVYKGFVPVAEHPNKPWDYIPWKHRVAARNFLIKLGKVPEFDRRGFNEKL